MDEAFINLLRSAWPVLVPTATIIIAFLSLRKKAHESLGMAASIKLASDLRDERLRSEITAVRYEVATVRTELRGQISDAINGKLVRIESKIDRIGERASELETNVATLKAISMKSPH